MIFKGQFPQLKRYRTAAPDIAGHIDVFISYKLEERQLTEGVMRGLRQAGFTAVTNFNIVKSQEFGDAIDKMIRTARQTPVCTLGSGPVLAS